jgi:nucleoside-diphosphate-sugar epimerase
MLTLDSDDCILVAGAGGFIGGHMVRTLRNAGYRRLRAVDLQPLEGWHQPRGVPLRIRHDGPPRAEPPGGVAEYAPTGRIQIVREVDGESRKASVGMEGSGATGR